MNRRDLVALIFADNTCYVQVVGLSHPKVKDVAIEGTRWSWEIYNERIGNSRPTSSYKEGIIGIYNRRKLKDLDSMAHDVREATYPYGEIGFDSD